MGLKISPENAAILNSIKITTVFFTVVSFFTVFLPAGHTHGQAREEASYIMTENMQQDFPPYPLVEFTYDRQTDTYNHTVLRTPAPGDTVLIRYSHSRKDVLFKYQERLWLRYSFDGWQTCTDQLMRFDREKDIFEATVKLPVWARMLSVAFFSTYEHKGKWYFIWDSKYGENFTISILSPKDIEDRMKFDILSGMELSRNIHSEASDFRRGEDR